MAYSPAQAYAAIRRRLGHGIRVKDLPRASTVGTGHTYLVTDALAPVAGDVVVGGGAVRTRVASDRTNWRVKGNP